MLSRFDDFPIHQTPDPLTVPGTGDRDFYERYWFNGYATDASLYFGVAAARYPHLGICDAALSVVYQGVQHCFFASGRSGQDPSITHTGPFRLEITEPMRSCRVVVEPNSTGWEADLCFEARTANVEEPRHTFGGPTRKVMDTTRFTQFGRWSGTIKTASADLPNHNLRFDPAETLGTKDRSWGVRPLAGGDPREAPPHNPNRGGLAFLWAPVHFDDICVHYQLFEDSWGRKLHSTGAVLPTYSSPDELPGVEDPATRRLGGHTHNLSFPDGGSRMINSAVLTMRDAEGEPYEVTLEKVFTFRMKGIGYTHPVWGHGSWHGDSALHSESWRTNEVDDSAFENQHVQHLMRATMGDRQGLGVLEQMILGPYHPYGFTDRIAP